MSLSEAKFLGEGGLRELITLVKNNFVQKETGKGLSTNDYTTTEKTKLSGIAEGAEVNVQSDWNVSDTSSDAYIANKPQQASSITSAETGYTTGAQVYAFVSSQAHVKFEKLTTDTTKDIYYSRSGETITIHVKTGVTPSTSTFYLVPVSDLEINTSYIEYYYDADNSRFEVMGSTEVDLSQYVKESDISTFTAAEVDTLWNATE